MRRPVLLATAAALLCAGCSTADSDGAADARASAAPTSSVTYRNAVRKAAETVGKGSAGVDERIEITGDGSTYTLTVAGDFDFAADRGSIAVDFPGGGIDHSEEVFADGKIYVSGTAGTDDGAWGVVARDKAEVHYALRAPLNDPEHVLRQVSAIRKVSKVGSETVDGVRAVRYRGVLSHAALTLRMADDVRDKMDQVRTSVGSDIPVFVDAWVDGKGRLVRTRMALNMSGSGVTATMDLSDFGEPVKPKVPKAADTYPATSVSGVLLG
ncbi:LppX_LprAFG lipoprotein [Streptomyces siamensis]|uniref:Lipoprotein n=1 Tax=Streptomyces siamensis TaxID=1274986 RepID=A0ABP9J4K1_9ACTN